MVCGVLKQYNAVDRRTSLLAVVHGGGGSGGRFLVLEDLVCGKGAV